MKSIEILKNDISNGNQKASTTLIPKIKNFIFDYTCWIYFDEVRVLIKSHDLENNEIYSQTICYDEKKGICSDRYYNNKPFEIWKHFFELILKNFFPKFKKNLGLNFPLEYFLEQCVNNQSDIYKYEFYYNVLKNLKNDKTWVLNTKEYREKKQVWDLYKDDWFIEIDNFLINYEHYCVLNLYEITENKKRGIIEYKVVKRDTKILLDNIKDQIISKNDLDNEIYEYHKCNEISKKITILNNIQKHIYKFLNQNEFKNIELFEKNQIKKYKKYTDDIIRHSSNEIKNKTKKSDNFNDLSTDDQEKFLNELLIIYLEIYVWCSFKKLL